MKDVKILFGQHLREIRERKGISQEKLAALAGLDRTYISKIERGERNISIETAAKLAEALEVPVTQLLERV